MERHRSQGRYQRFLKPGITLVIVLLLFAVMFWQALQRIDLFWVMVIVILAVGMAGATIWYASRARRLLRDQENIQDHLHQVEEQLQVVQRRLGIVRDINAQLVNANDERQLVNSVMDQLADLTGAIGCSFVPLDDLGQPLPAFSRGKLPEAVLNAWTEHLTSPEVRERCAECQNLHSETGQGCPLLVGPYQRGTNVHCLPVRREDRLIGMLNLFITNRASLEEDTRGFIEGLLNQVAVAVEAIRLHNQEAMTLRQLQMVRSPQIDLETSLTSLLEQVQTALQADFGILVAQLSSRAERRITVVRGRAAEGMNTFLEGQVREVMSSREPAVIAPARDAGTFPDGQGSLLCAPLLLPGQAPLGAIILGSDHSLGLHGGQLNILRAVAVQAALLAEYDRLMVDLEYHTVINERSRLAREIHDGLAQTLAYLKLQTGQMQNYLAKGELSRLEQALRSSYQALTEAYLDTRQSIDNLRVTPQLGLQQWLEQLADDFRATTGLSTELLVQPDIKELSTEIQAQLIRIMQEALSNVRKHANASKVMIQVKEWAGDLILEVTDDGEGFFQEDIPGISKYGLRGMRERAELIGADFQIISQPRQGTTVRLSMPYPLEETRHE